MNTLNIDSFGLECMSNTDLIFIDGGHDGPAYQAGKALGEVVKFTSTVFGIIAIILVPKS